MFPNVTMDQVYDNNEQEWEYVEHDQLDDYDLYSNSKSCSELVTHSYIYSFFTKRRLRSLRTDDGNVIGGEEQMAGLHRVVFACL